MDGTPHSASRDERGRFVPGQSGNPAGKRPGTRNRTSLLAAALAEGEGEAVARVVIDKALGGDAVAARFLMERLSPKPRGRTIALDLPEGESAAGEVIAMFNSALRALASGQITPDEAVAVSRFLEGRTRVLRAWALERRMTTYDDQPPIPGDDWVPDEEFAPTEPPSVAPASRRQDAAATSDDGGEGEGEDAGGTPALRSAERQVAPGTVPAGLAPPHAPLHFTCISQGSPRPAAALPGLVPIPAAVALRHGAPYVPASPDRRPA